MKKLLFAVFAFCCSTIAFSQTDTALKKRLTVFMEANNKLDIKTVLDYTYPKLFTIVPKDQMFTVMQQSFDNEQMTIKLDSLKTDKIFPVLETKQGSYVKILYSMKMLMHLKNADADSAKQKAQRDYVALAMKAQPGVNKVDTDSNGNLVVYMNAAMVAVKDTYADDWCFINLKEGDPTISQLFSKEIIDKLANYK